MAPGRTDKSQSGGGGAFNPPATLMDSYVVRMTQPNEVFEVGCTPVFPVNDVMHLAPSTAVTPGKSTGDIPVFHKKG